MTWPPFKDLNGSCNQEAKRSTVGPVWGGTSSHAARTWLGSATAGWLTVAAASQPRVPAAGTRLADAGHAAATSLSCSGGVKAVKYSTRLDGLLGTPRWWVGVGGGGFGGERETTSAPAWLGSQHTVLDTGGGGARACANVVQPPRNMQASGGWGVALCCHARQGTHPAPVCPSP